MHIVDGDQIESTHKAGRVVASACEHCVIIQGHILAFLVDKLADECSLPPRLDIPKVLSNKVLADLTVESRDTVDADLWFSEWGRGGTLVEEVRHLPQWDQTLSLLWFEYGDVPARKFRDERGAVYEEEENEDDALLKELDGNLRWPGKHRRRWRIEVGRKTTMIESSLAPGEMGWRQ